MTKKQILLTVAVALVVSLGVVLFGAIKSDSLGSVRLTADKFTQGLYAGLTDQFAIDKDGDITTRLDLDAGQLRSYTNATGTTATAQTLKAADILGYDTILFTPNKASVTLTLPASSTLTSLVPTAGDMAEQCWYNATTTASTNIVFAAGTGIDLKVASSTSQVGGAFDLTIAPGQMGCFKYVRKAATASTFDIIAGLVEYNNAD